jgi:periodic tryptophan protein 1
MLHRFDIRNVPKNPSAAKSVWTLQAHDERISALDINPQIPGFIVTGSTDKTVKIWDIADSTSGPTVIASRNLGVGKVFSATFAPDVQTAFRLAVAGSKGNLQIWDTSTNPAVRRAFAGKVSEANLREGKDRLIGVAKDDSDDDREPGGIDIAGGDGWESDDDAMST